METIFDTALPEDFDETMDFGNYVFSHSSGGIDFPSTLPKLYKRNYFMEGIHYTAREGGRIKAAVGAYPLELDFSGPGMESTSLGGRGIGMVSVHPYSRSRGYMKELMNRALEDMRRDNIVFSCLGGLRQRYEYFGFSPAGSVYNFTCTETNIRHTMGTEWRTGLSFKDVEAGDESFLDSIHALHETKIARYRRQRDRLYDILTSWKARVLAITEGDSFQGYLVYKAHGTDHEISEIMLHDLSRLPEVLALFLRNGKAVGMQGKVNISAGPHEREKITVLSRFTERYTLHPVYNFAVFDYQRFVAPFLKLVEREKALPEGKVILEIEGGSRYCLTVEAGKASIAGTTASGELVLTRGEALQFFFSPLGEHIFPVIREKPFLQSLLPLPLFYENPDGI